MRSTFFMIDGLFADHIKNSGKHDMKIQHYHDAYEIYYQTDGRRYLFLDDICYTLTKGDLVILKPFAIHHMESRDSDGYERELVNFHSEALSCILTDAEISMLFDGIDSCVIKLSEQSQITVIECMRRVRCIIERGGFLWEKAAYSVILQLMLEVKYSLDGAEHVTHKNTPPEIVEAIRFIGAHYREPIGLDEVTELVHMSKYHFCRVFHEATGATFLEYLYNVRLTYVHRYLTDTTLTVTQIAERTGFSSSSHLARVFSNAYKMTPSKFRKKVNNK